MRAITQQAAVLLAVWAALVGPALLVGQPALVAGVVGAALACAWGLAQAVAVRSAPGVPAVAARALHRMLASRAAPRQRDPDAPGHVRSRAPSAGTPAG